MTLVDRWSADWADLGTPPPDERIRAALLARYAETRRAYHTAQHLEECFALFDRHRGLAVRPGEIAIALWFHDAFYDSRASDNEARSAAWAEEVVATAGGGSDASARVRDLVLATRHLAPVGSGDEALLADIDLAILGADAGRFEEYEAQIRREYSWVPEATYRATRARLLKSFLARPRIYATARFAEQFEARARANLQRSIARLGG